MNRALIRALSFASLPFLVGCADLLGDSDAHVPGTSLGGFHVTATEIESSCGEGALGATQKWEFDVQLSRTESEIFWGNGAEMIGGDLAADGVTFSFASRVSIDMRTEEDLGKAPCAVERTDSASGVLDSAETVSGFSGSLGYDYAPQGECGDLVDGETPLFAALPCSMRFSMSGVLSDPPASE